MKYNEIKDEKIKNIVVRIIENNFLSLDEIENSDLSIYEKRTVYNELISYLMYREMSLSLAKYDLNYVKGVK